MKRIWIPAIIVAAFVCVIFVLRSVALAWIVGVIVVTALGLGWYYRVPIRIAVQAKLAEWRSDIKQLGLWLQLAFRRNRTAPDTAAMAHQQQFLAGRLMSPMNLFAIAAAAVALVPLTFGFQEWRISRIKAERDAPCSERELTLNRGGRYQTTREACATLGDTLQVVAGWERRARDFETLREQEIATLRADVTAQLADAQARAARAEESAARQRRRQNEAITAALGGPAPDLERSVCELAGNENCDGPGAADGGGSAAPADLPANAGGAGDAANAGPSAADPAAGGD